MLESLKDSKGFDMIKKIKCRTEPQQNAPGQNKQLKRHSTKILWSITPPKKVPAIWKSMWKMVPNPTTSRGYAEVCQ